MAEIHTLLNTDASNTSRFNGAGNVSTMDDAGRALEGMLSRFFKDIDGTNTTLGSNTAYTVSLNRTGITSNAEVRIAVVRFHVANSGAVTLQFNSLPALSLRKTGGGVLVTGDILTNDLKFIGYNPAFGTFQIMGQ